MEKTALGLIAAFGAAVAAPAAYASVAPATAEKILNPTSIAELLEPVANPVATLNELQSQRQLEAVEEPGVQVAEEMVVIHHHHHHHHHRVVIMRRYHHHHHHHFYHHHHHHHHHNY